MYQSMSPWYDRRGWLGIKKQRSIYLSIQDHSRRQFCVLFQFWLASDVSVHALLFNEAILVLFRSDAEESDFSGFSASEN